MAICVYSIGKLMNYHQWWYHWGPSDLTHWPPSRSKWLRCCWKLRSPSSGEPHLPLAMLISSSDINVNGLLLCFYMFLCTFLHTLYTLQYYSVLLACYDQLYQLLHAIAISIHNTSRFSFSSLEGTACPTGQSSSAKCWASTGWQGW